MMSGEKKLQITFSLEKLNQIRDRAKPLWQWQKERLKKNTGIFDNTLLLHVTDFDDFVETLKQLTLFDEKGLTENAREELRKKLRLFGTIAGDTETDKDFVWEMDDIVCAVNAFLVEVFAEAKKSLACLDGADK